MGRHPVFYQPVHVLPWWTFIGQHGWARVHVRPSRESVQKSLRSQDVAALVPHEEWMGVLCDGVSQSFYGDFAAWILAEALVSWLHHVPFSHTPHVQELMRWGRENARQSQVRYALLPLPAGLPAMMRRVMEEKRRLGSEAMFAAFRVWPPSPEVPRGRVLVVHGGNIRIRLIPAHPAQTPEKTLPMNEAVRWSTQRGFTGPPHVWSDALLDEEGRWKWAGLVAYTDGIPSLDPIPLPWDHEQVKALAEKDWNSPLTDDQGMVELVWQPSSSPEGAVPPPASARWHTTSWTTSRTTEGLLHVQNGDVPRGGYLRFHWQNAQGATHVWSTPEPGLRLPREAVRVQVEGVDAQGQGQVILPWQTVAPHRQSTEQRRPSRGSTQIVVGVVVLLLLAYFALLVIKGYGLG